jgi:hypothetical protein
MSLPLAIICDLDSTLCNNDHRSIHAQNKEWAIFHSKCTEDTPNLWCVEIIESFRVTHRDIIFFFITGRPDRMKFETLEWITKHLSEDVLRNAFLMMKPSDWKQGSASLKEMHYKTIIEGKFDILFVLEDEGCVVEMWRKLGLVCLQPADNNFER